MPKRAEISIRKPPRDPDPDAFVAEGKSDTKALKHQSTKAQQVIKSTTREPTSRSSTTYTRKGDGVTLKRTNLWLPQDVRTAIMVHAASSERDASDVVTEAVCRLLKLEWPR
jgi:hypothetical protein